MSDQKRWFKLWHSALSDDRLMSLPADIRWAWAALGAHTKVHGTNGVVTISTGNSVLAAQMGVAAGDLVGVISLLPHVFLGTHSVRWPHGHEKPPVCDGYFVRGGEGAKWRGGDPLEEWCERHGRFTVTWKNWTHFQEDSTQAERSRASRSKRRGEEKRGEESVPHTSNGFGTWPEEWAPIRELIVGPGALPFLAKHATWIGDLDWWQTMKVHYSSCPRPLASLLTDAVAYIQGEGYHPRTKAAIRRKLNNCMEFAASKSERRGGGLFPKGERVYPQL